MNCVIIFAETRPKEMFNADFLVDGPAAAAAAFAFLAAFSLTFVGK